MDDLRALIKVMRVGEKRMLRHLLARKTNAEEHQRFRLFQLIDSGKADSEDHVKMLLGLSSSSAFSHLKRRLRDDILSVLLIKESSKRIAQANRAAQFECLKKLAQAYVLIFRGAKTEGQAVLDAARALAVEYELSAELLSIDQISREAFYSFLSGDELNNLNQALRDDLENCRHIIRSEELSFLITMPKLRNQLLAQEEDGVEDRMVEEFEELYRKSGAARVGFWYYMAAVEKKIADKQFEDVLVLGKQFLTLVEESASVRSKNNIAGVNQSLGFAYLNLRIYDQAVGHLKRSERNFPAAGFNRIQCLFFLAQAELAWGRFDDVLDTVNSAMSHPRIKAREQLVPRWLFIKASAEFLMGNVDGAFKTMNQDGYLLRQQDDWNIQFRLLEMMLLVEMRDEEWLEFKLDATRKFLTRYKQLDTPRVRTAVDILGNLLRKELDISQLSSKNLEALTNCFDEVDGFEWDPSGSELVRFDRWITAKLPKKNDKAQGE